MPLQMQAREAQHTHGNTRVHTWGHTQAQTSFHIYIGTVAATRKRRHPCVQKCFHKYRCGVSSKHSEPLTNKIHTNPISHSNGDRKAGDVVGRAGALLAQVACSQQLAQVRHSWELEPQGKWSRWLGGWSCGRQADSPAHQCLCIHTHQEKGDKSRNMEERSMLSNIEKNSNLLNEGILRVEGCLSLVSSTSWVYHVCSHAHVLFCSLFFLWKCISLFTAWGLISCRSCWRVPLTSGPDRDRQALIHLKHRQQPLFSFQTDLWDISAKYLRAYCWATHSFTCCIHLNLTHTVRSSNCCHTNQLNWIHMSITPTSRPSNMQTC